MNNNIRFLQTGGVPLTNDLMATIQEAYQLFEVLGDVAGHLTILKGCEVNGSTIEPGIVAINGEIFPFEGGLTASTVYVHTQEIEKTFEDQTDKVLIEKKTVRFGNAVETYNWQDFVRLDTLKVMKAKLDNAATSQQITAINERLELLELKTAPIINGGIVFPFKKPFNEIPDGWKECTDLRGKTIVGLDPNDTDFNELGETGGAKTHTLTIAEMPSHSHSYKDAYWSEYGGNGEPSTRGSGGNDDFDNKEYYKWKTTGVNGGSQPHNNLQPYRIVLFIEPNFQ